MKTLPAKYTWLLDLALPRVIIEALKLYGIEEKPGRENAPEIMAWAKQLDLVHDYVADAVPWCGLFVAFVIYKADWPVVRSPLWARNWATFGDNSPEPGLGDVLVFQRAAGGHVGFYIGEDAGAYHVLGGNQGDRVSIVRVAKDRLVAARRPHWRVAKPDSVKPYRITAAGDLSGNEA